MFPPPPPCLRVGAFPPRSLVYAYVTAVVSFFLFLSLLRLLIFALLTWLFDASVAYHAYRASPSLPSPLSLRVCACVRVIFFVCVPLHFFFVFQLRACARCGWRCYPLPYVNCCSLFLSFVWKSITRTRHRQRCEEECRYQRTTCQYDRSRSLRAERIHTRRARRGRGWAEYGLLGGGDAVCARAGARMQV